MSERHETELEMARRHVREGEERLARQMAVLVQLERQATAVLANTHAALDLARRHLRTIEERSKPKR